MQKQTWIFFSITATMLAATLLLAGRSDNTNPGVQKGNTACCKVKMQECLKKQKANAPGEMIMESLSRQFLMTTPF